MADHQCCENPPLLSSSCGEGHEEVIGGLKCYVIGSPHDSKPAVVLVSDIFGYQAPKLRKIADKVAAFGFFVVVPDFFYGDPYAPENAERPPFVWGRNHEPEKGFEDAKQVIEALKCKGISRIGAAGFCWGAKVVVELAKYADVQATVLLHPTYVSWQDVQSVQVPISVLGAEIDRISPPQLLEKFAEVLKAKPEVAGFVKIFPGATHGWTVRYRDEDPVAVRLADEAHKDMVDWFVKKLADKCAATGYLVVVPDFLHGDPFDKSKPNRTFQAWSDAHPIDKATDAAISLIEALKAKGVSTIGCAGFCWGAKIVVKLAQHPHINAAVLLHPSFVTLDEILAVKVPISILGAENDQISPPELLKQFGEALEAKKEVDCFLKIFPGVLHGWTVKYPGDDKEAVKHAEEAHQDMLDWFSKFIC